MQRFTSKDTSINKTRLPAVYRKLDFSKMDVVLDYGCGRYTEHIAAFLAENNVRFLPYDKYNQDAETNAASLAAAADAAAEGKRLSVICSNVLNVIDDDREIARILEEIRDIVRAANGQAYITVYEGDGSGQGRQTGPDQYQRNEKLRAYKQRFCQGAKSTMGMLILT